jgi:hypothetical protein
MPSALGFGLGLPFTPAPPAGVGGDAPFDASPYSPTLYLKASAGLTEPSPPAVTVWADQSGNGRDFTAINGPEEVAGPGVRLVPASSQYLHRDGSDLTEYLDYAGHSIYAVLTVHGVGAYGAPGGYFTNDQLFGDAGEYLFFGLYQPADTPKAVVSHYNGGYSTPADVDVDLDVRLLIAVRYGGGTLAISRDGGAETTQAAPEPILLTNARIGKTGSGGNYANVTLHALMTRDVRSNDTDHTAIIAGLKTEWGI